MVVFVPCGGDADFPCGLPAMSLALDRRRAPRKVAADPVFPTIKGYGVAGAPNMGRLT
jgi:hypothetical protein